MIDKAFSAFLSGMPIKYDGRTYKLFKPGETIPLPSWDGTTEEYWVGLKVEVQDINGSREAYVGAGDIPFSLLLKILSQITEEDFVRSVCNKVVGEYYRGNIK